MSTLTQDLIMLRAFLVRTKGLKVLVDLLTLDTSADCDEEDHVDWKSAVYELFLLVAHNREALGLNEHDISTIVMLPVLALVRSEREARYRRLALQFLLVNRSSTCQDAIVESGGISLLVEVLSTECDDATSTLLLELLHSIAATSTSHVQEIDLVVQSIVDSNKPSEFDHTNLLRLVYHEQTPLGSSETEADRHLFTLQASVRILLFAGSNALHKYIALNCVRRALPEIGLAFVFDYEGIALLWDIVMVDAHEEMTYIAIEILRWLARENEALRDHILEFFAQYAAVQETETKSKAASIHQQIFGGRNKRKRSASVGCSQGRTNQQSDMDARSEGTEGMAGCNAATTSSGSSMQPDVPCVKEAGSSSDSDCGEFLYSSDESETEPRTVQAPANASAGKHRQLMSHHELVHEEHKDSSPATQ